MIGGIAIVERTAATGPAVAPLLLDATGAAALLGCGRRKLFALLAGGEVPAPVRFGKRLTWRRAELEDWTRAGCPPACRWTWPPKI
jgi:predicted DNA-binding transcriptional regulator AlpA